MSFCANGAVRPATDPDPPHDADCQQDTEVSPPAAIESSGVKAMSNCGGALLCLMLTATLQGCLLTRILETRRQPATSSPRVIVTQRPESGLRVVFEKPTPTDRDVVWIVGYEPTEITGANAAREFFYEARPFDRPLDHAASLVVRLSFARVDDEYRLSEVEIPEKFNSILPPSLLDAAVRVVCKTNIGVVPPSTTFDLTSFGPGDIANPRCADPTSRGAYGCDSRSDEISYQYCLAPC